MSDPQQPYGAQPTGAQPTGAPQPPAAGYPQQYPGQPPHAQPATPQSPPSAAPQYPGQAPQYPGQATQSQQAPPSQQFAQAQPVAPGQAPQYGTAQYGTAQYGTAQYGASQYGASQPSGNPLGRIAFFAAAGAVVLNLLATLISPILFRAGNYDVAGSLSGVLTILVVLLSVVAVVLALIALRGPGSRLFPAIALGAAGSTFLSYALTWISNLFYVF
ncbi:hypothetical protein ACI3KS_13465 [Microbacterium sp. ZW T5_45]|uniref:hypothetical protein n=1 Tax=Microbacterium sp. ZW T5_45 TaxID=3378080 RepID=UPI003853B727